MSDVLINLLREVSNDFQERLQGMASIEALKLAPFQARLLSVIGRHPAISQLTLAASTDRDKAQIARAIKELERRGFVARSEHETDWRTQCLDLTEAGKRASKLIEQERKELVAKALSDFSTEEQDALGQALEKIKRAIGPAKQRQDN